MHIGCWNSRKQIAYLCPSCGWAGRRGRGLKICPGCGSRLPQRTKELDEIAMKAVEEREKRSAGN